MKDSKEIARAKDGTAVETTQTANYSMLCSKNIVNNTSITVNCNNVFGQDNPTVFGGFGNTAGYPVHLRLGRTLCLCSAGEDVLTRCVNAPCQTG